MKKMIHFAVALLMASATFAQEELFSQIKVLDGKDWITLPIKTAGKYDRGFTLAENGTVIVCDNGNDKKASRGAYWGIKLNQQEPLPVTVSAESLNENLIGNFSDGYYIYLDISYMNGKHLWGQTACFAPTGDGKWRQKMVTVVPEYPIRQISAYVLLRGVGGKAQFKNIKYRVHPKNSVKQVDGCAMSSSQLQREPYFMIRDVAANTGYSLIRNETMGIRLNVKETKKKDVTLFDVNVENLAGRDRAFTLTYAYPLPRGELIWHRNLRTGEVVKGGPERRSVQDTGVGTGCNSRFPITAVSANGDGYALGGDPEAPVFSRMIFNPQIHQLLFASDIALTPEVPRAHYRFCLFRFDAKNALRGALEKYYAIYPGNSRVRVKEQGIWMAFHPISKVRGWEDFGFKFKEGDDEPAWDDAHNMLTFRYTEPCTWWMAMKKEGYTYEDCVAETKRLLQAGNRSALAWESSVFENGEGELPGRILDTPWCKGIVWSVNSAPGIQGKLSHYNLHNGGQSFARRYSKPFPEGIDGEYVDSAEMYVTDMMDYRRSHFAGMKTPLTFSPVTHRPVIFKGLIGYEYVRRQAERVHAKGRYSMANSTPVNWWWLAPYLDIMGQETNWNRHDRWSPMRDEDLMYRRALAGAKPYCFLMNTDFTKFSKEYGRKYMMRCLAYGMFPSYFSANASGGHYFSRPALYNRDRPLFKKYVPLCKRVAEAGWRPVNRLLASSNKDVITEQFGAEQGNSYATVFNLSDKPQTVTLEWKTRAPRETELMSGEKLQWTGKKCALTIPAETVKVLAF